MRKEAHIHICVLVQLQQAGLDGALHHAGINQGDKLLQHLCNVELDVGDLSISQQASNDDSKAFNLIVGTQVALEHAACGKHDQHCNIALHHASTARSRQACQGQARSRYWQTLSLEQETTTGSMVAHSTS